MYTVCVSRRFTIEILYKKFTYIGGILFRKKGQYRGKVFILPVETKCEPSNIGRSYSPIHTVMCEMRS